MFSPTVVFEASTGLLERTVISAILAAPFALVGFVFVHSIARWAYWIWIMVTMQCSMTKALQMRPPWLSTWHQVRLLAVICYVVVLTSVFAFTTWPPPETHWPNERTEETEQNGCR
jgi:hypothetical protein